MSGIFLCVEAVGLRGAIPVLHPEVEALYQDSRVVVADMVEDGGAKKHSSCRKCCPSPRSGVDGDIKHTVGLVTCADDVE